MSAAVHIIGRSTKARRARRVGDNATESGAGALSALSSTPAAGRFAAPEAAQEGPAPPGSGALGKALT